MGSWRAVEQLGVRQGYPLSPLLVLFMEPFAELVRRDPGVGECGCRGVRRVLKIQQYADDTTMFVSSARSLGRIRALTDLFGAGTGSKVNLAKSSVLYCGCWRGDRSGGGFSVCTVGLRSWASGSLRQRGFELGGQAQPGAHQTGSLDPPSAVTDWQGRGGAVSALAAPHSPGVTCSRSLLVPSSPSRGWFSVLVGR
ncbi:hypothetical protein AAFF_G00076250 [Aldrovandia affinis]|uniref:Reverse transcriptase domain-containing protein n=1 Tax=Aldrovandia affinis TaxID=143900 RepID=A0AAD7R1S1_9TELE|nr:hypothetical protein AAFF_G00076250 [Aldrovandia affinis]